MFVLKLSIIQYKLRVIKNIFLYFIVPLLDSMAQDLGFEIQKEIILLVLK